MATDLPNIIEKVVSDNLINDEQPSLVSQYLLTLTLLFMLYVVLSLSIYLGGEGEDLICYFRICMTLITSGAECPRLGPPSLRAS